MQVPKQAMYAVGELLHCKHPMGAGVPGVEDCGCAATLGQVVDVLVVALPSPFRSPRAAPKQAGAAVQVRSRTQASLRASQTAAPPW